MKPHYLILTLATCSALSAISTAWIINNHSNPSALNNNQEQQTQFIVRLNQVEDELQRETQARLSLEQQLLTVLSNIPTASTTLTVEPELTQNIASIDETDQFDDNTELNDTQISNAERRRRRLLDYGFSEDQIAQIQRSESDIALRSLNDQYRARRQRQQAQQNGNQFKSQSQRLREQVGDETFERYLAANGLPTSVGINSVLDNSPGADAGIQAGDQIINYAGERVFSIRDLNNLTTQGQEGESILVEIDRQGELVQLTIPRGPIGITSNPRFGGNQ